MGPGPGRPAAGAAARWASCPLVHRLPAPLSGGPVPRPRPSSPLPASYSHQPTKTVPTVPPGLFQSSSVLTFLWYLTLPVTAVMPRSSLCSLLCPSGYSSASAWLPCTKGALRSCSHSPPFCLLRHRLLGSRAQCRFGTAACLRCSPFLAETASNSEYPRAPSSCRTSRLCAQGPRNLSLIFYFSGLILDQFSPTSLPSLCSQEALFMCVCVSGLPASSSTLSFSNKVGQRF